MKFMKAIWSNIIMANYAIDPRLLEPYLPYGTELDYFNGRTYISLVGFMFMQSRIFGVPVPGLGTFEEVNLRFYVKREEAGIVKRGVVFINETVPYAAVAWVARGLYKEKYTRLPVGHDWRVGEREKEIRYSWDIAGKKNNLYVKADSEKRMVEPHSMEDYILDHYYGYTRITAAKTTEFSIDHPRWTIHPVTDFRVKVDFEAMYGSGFSYLSATEPEHLLLTEGSGVTIEWARRVISTKKQRIVSSL